MNILVLNGSPKGKFSVTLQTVYYIEQKYTEHKFTVLDVGATINGIERDFTKSAELLKSCDAIIFSYPVYNFLAPSQLHRFIELVKSSNVDLRGKLATQITTSKHFYDMTAHKFIEENCHDLGMRYVRGLSADMADILAGNGRLEAEQFFDFFIHSAEKGIFEKPEAVIRRFIPELPTESAYNEAKKDDRFDVVIVTDATDENSSIYKMIEKFRATLPYKARVVNISEYPFLGGCLGCFACAASGKCVYKDGFDEFLRKEIRNANAIVYAFTIKDHSMGSRFKMYDDRSFCNGLRAVTAGTPIGYLVSGEYSKEHNIRTIIEGRASCGQNFLAGVATDERGCDRRIEELSANLVFALESHHTVPQTFLGVGGGKIYRDFVFEMRGIMRADHKFYRKHKKYDFPQKKFFRSVKMYRIGLLLGNKKLRAKVGFKMNNEMLAPYRKMLNEQDRVDNGTKK